MSTNPTESPVPDLHTYLGMARAHYASLVARSDYSTDAFTVSNGAELVVGHYALHEMYDYEAALFGGIDIAPTAIAIEYGCGPGRMLRRLSRRFERIDGVDISPDVLDVARAHCAHLPTPPRLFVTDGQGVPSDLVDAYDVAFSVICLQHVPVHSIRRRVLDSFFRALKPGGLLTFQMGYGPGHRAMIDYFGEYLGAPSTNGSDDVTVLHPAEIAGDLESAGFADAEYTLLPTGPGDTHAAWIFARARKPGPSVPCLSTSADARARAGFRPLVRDAAGAERARRTYREHGIPRRRRHLEQVIATLRAEGDARRSVPAPVADDSSSVVSPASA